MVSCKWGKSACLFLALGLVFAQAGSAQNFLSPREARERGESFGHTLEQRARVFAFSDTEDEKREALRAFRRGLEVVGLDLGLAPFPDSELRATAERRTRQIAGNAREHDALAEHVERKLDQANGTHNLMLLMALQKSGQIMESRHAYSSGLRSSLGAHAWELIQTLGSMQPCIEGLRQALESPSEQAARALLAGLAKTLPTR